MHAVTGQQSPAPVRRSAGVLRVCVKVRIKVLMRRVRIKVRVGRLASVVEAGVGGLGLRRLGSVGRRLGRRAGRAVWQAI